MWDLGVLSLPMPAYPPQLGWSRWGKSGPPCLLVVPFLSSSWSDQGAEDPGRKSRIPKPHPVSFLSDGHTEERRASVA